MDYIAQHAQHLRQAIRQIKNKIVEVLYLLLSSAKSPRRQVHYIAYHARPLPWPIQRIKIKIGEALYLLLSLAHNH